MDTIISLVGVLVIVLALTILIATIPVMLLWNWLVPDIFGLTAITFWQAMGIVTLCSFLFKSSNTTSK